jgi:farnesyl diphosphate synthase
MDNDVLGRGLPTTHKAFDEATAVLAGDALLTFAFDAVTRFEAHPESSVRLELVRGLSRAAGLGGMVGGQILDLGAEGRFTGGVHPEASDVSIRRLQSMKTGALIKFACDAGGIIGNASEVQRAALSIFGSAIGEAFQIADDLLDVEGDSAKLGKAVKKDAHAGKATLVDLMGAESARSRLNETVSSARKALACFGDKADLLSQAAGFIAQRDS